MSSEGDIWQSATGQEYLVWMLDFDFKEEPPPKYIPDYWTRLEHQYAGMAMQGLISLSEWPEETTDVDVTETASKYAHALVEKLKEKEERK